MAMTRDEVIRMAKEAGLVSPSPYAGVWDNYAAALERFAELVAKAEREACAKVCEETDVEQFTHCSVLHDDGRLTLANAAAAIRARGGE